jgi:membrane protein DedA with SNARE-associated domain
VIGAVGSANDNDGFDKLDHAVTAGLTVLGAGAGAITGYLIGRSGHKRVLIYEAK